MIVFAAVGLVAVGLAIGWLLASIRARRHQASAAVQIAAATSMLQRAEASDSTERIATPLAGHDALENALVALDRAVGEVVADRDDDAERRHELARALDAIPQGVVVVDRVGHEVFRNRFALDFETARHGEALVAAAIEESLAAALAGASEQRPVDLFGPPRRNFVVTAMPLHANDRLVGAVALVEDVTERRRLDAVRRDFVANISHELKTPIGALALLAETLVEEEDSAVARRLAERMLSEALRVNRTIEDLLELTRIENEELPQREHLPIHLVVAEAVERIRPAAAQADIPIVVDEPNRRLAVIGDRRQLVSAVYNLLDNAVKYSDAGDPVRVRATTDGMRVEIAVEDRGVGIPAKDLDRVFERFYRVDPGRSRQTGGTGLGLAIVRHVASNHAGEVRVESRLGEGSTFTLSLPTASGPVLLTDAERAS